MYCASRATQCISFHNLGTAFYQFATRSLPVRQQKIGYCDYLGQVPAHTVRARLGLGIISSQLFLALLLQDSAPCLHCRCVQIAALKITGIANPARPALPQWPKKGNREAQSSPFQLAQSYEGDTLQKPADARGQNILLDDLCSC